jgi:hypothetical protein
MDDLQQTPPSKVLVNCDLLYADQIIEQLDGVIQDTGNLALSSALNDILDSYDSIRKILKG